MKERKIKTAFADMYLSILRTYIRYSPFNFKKIAAWKQAYKYCLWRTTLTPRKAKTQTGHLINVAPPDAVQTSIYMTGVWEPSITAYVSATLRTGDTFIDIGANVGYYSLLGSEIVGKHGKVFALEASPNIYHELTANIKRNRISNITSIKALIGSEHGERDFWSGGARNLGQSTCVAKAAQQEGFILEGKVQSYRLEDVIDFKTITNARLIKIDVEGAELEVLAPLLPRLQEFSEGTEWILEVTPELYPRGHEDAIQIFQSFFSSGYRAYQLPNPYNIAHYLTRPRFPRLEEIVTTPNHQVDVLFTRQKKTTPHSRER
ncbi:FkbM family methyltransferase [Ectothiorhodospira variabilis]|uniref:FkbM family methyltransferase n=1 Tax=Ectothiorhodospira variabilis TaxID=505694 RepID=UPI001EFBC9A6|nr:FkbM family methyltransferase [Ectothiorhodospira variabilis]MCG5497540.1 FkbM family methyltransferase [Ectothiorhodospira variabilis]